MDQRSVFACIRGGIPAILWGPPGVGKTAFILSLAESIGLPARILIASWLSPQDFGFPVLSGESMEIGGRTYQVIDLIPPRIAVETATTGGILFLDELTSTPPALQAPLLALLQGHRFGDLQLDPSRTIILAAANPPHQAASGWELSLPMANRMAHLQFATTAEEFADHFPAYWGRAPRVGFGLGLDPDAWGRARAMIAAFIRTRPSLLLQLPQEGEEAMAFPSPRTWDFASRVLGDAIACGENPASAIPAVEAVIGRAAAVELFTFLKELDLPDPASLLADPEGFPLPDRLDKLFATLSSVADYASRHLESFPAAVRIFERAAESGRRDVVVATVKPLMRCYDEHRSILPAPASLLDSLAELLSRLR